MREQRQGVDLSRQHGPEQQRLQDAVARQREAEKTLRAKEREVAKLERSLAKETGAKATPAKAEPKAAPAANSLRGWRNWTDSYDTTASSCSPFSR